jgi:hypothetical protein
MHYMAKPVSFRWDEEFVARLDEARGDVPRSAFVRRAIEQALAPEVESHADLRARIGQSARLIVGNGSPKVVTGRLGKGPVQPRPKKGK